MGHGVEPAMAVVQPNEQDGSCWRCGEPVTIEAWRLGPGYDRCPRCNALRCIECGSPIAYNTSWGTCPKCRHWCCWCHMRRSKKGKALCPECLADLHRRRQEFKNSRRIPPQLRTQEKEYDKRRRVPDRLRRQMLADPKAQCAYCGCSLHRPGEKIHIDHVIPASAGGPSLAANLVLACASCNLSKGTDLEKTSVGKRYVRDGKCHWVWKTKGWRVEQMWRAVYREAPALAVDDVVRAEYAAKMK